MPAVTGLNFQAKNTPVDLSVINMTSGWCKKVVSLKHRTWNVRVNDKTGKKEFVPDDTSEQRVSVLCKQIFRNTHLDAFVCICKKNSES